MILASISKFIFSIALCLSAGSVGSLFTLYSIPEWYDHLQKPSFTPPGWLFGPVWTVLYILMGTAAYLVWSKGLGQPAVRKALIVFLIQLVLNSAWSFLFFWLRSPLYGLIDILLLWGAILITIGQFSRVSVTAAALLIPYLLWVTFASGLNLGIWLLN